MKLTVDEIDDLLISKKSSDYDKEKDTEPPLRKPIDLAVRTGLGLGGAVAGGVAALSRVKTNLPLKELQ